MARPSYKLKSNIKHNPLVLITQHKQT